MAEARNLGDERASRRIIDPVDALADPVAVDEARVPEQRGIGEFHREASKVGAFASESQVCDVARRPLRGEGSEASFESCRDSPSISAKGPLPIARS